MTWVSLVQVVFCEAFVAFCIFENAFVAESFRFIMSACNCRRNAAQHDKQHDTMSRDIQHDSVSRDMQHAIVAHCKAIDSCNGDV